MRAMLERWIADAPNYVQSEIRVPEVSAAKDPGLEPSAGPWTKAANLPSLKLLRSRSTFDKSGTTCDWSVRTEQVRGGWRAVVRIPFAALGFDPGRDPCVRFLAMVSQSYGGAKSQTTSWTLGGGLPHAPLSWTTLRVEL